MLKKIPASKIFFIELCMFFTVSLQAHADFGYKLLAEIPTIPGGQANSFPFYLKSIFVLAVGISIVASVFMIVLGGIKYITAAVPASKEDGKKYITDSLLGLILVLSSWVLLNTLNPKLLSAGLSLPEVVISVDPPLPAGTVTRTGIADGSGGIVGAPGNVSVTGTGNASAILKNDSNISFQTNYVSVDGMRDATANAVVSLQKGCNCNVTINSGTDGTSHNPGAYSHYNGYKVDLAPTSDLNSYIKNTSNQIVDRNDGASQWQDKNNPNIIYALESTHWDVLVK